MTAQPVGPQPQSSDAMIATLYDELHAIARREHARAGGRATLQATALVSEAYLKLHRRDGWQSQAHFLGCAATAMRHVLIDAARARMAAKRDAREEGLSGEDAELVRLDKALTALAAQDETLAKLVECRFFGGLDEAETAAVLGVSDRTVRRWWVQARAWIHGEMTAD